jgi:hypothetical protein
MITTQTRTSAERLPNPAGLVLVVLAAAAIAAIAYHARTGAVSPRIANPDVTGVPRPVEFLFGWPHWLVLHQLGTVVMMLALVAACVWAWRRHPAHPYLLMVAASTAIVWQDPIMNWAPYAVYNPQLWHFPEDWPLVRLSPTSSPSSSSATRRSTSSARSSRRAGSSAVCRLVRPSTSRVAPPLLVLASAALRRRVRHGRGARDLPRAAPGSTSTRRSRRGAPSSPARPSSSR